MRVRHASAFAFTLAFVAIGLALAFQVRASRVEPRFQLNTDDAYIHAHIADNLARTGVLGLNPGVRGGGSSSLAWTLLLASFAKAGVPADRAAWLLSLLFWGLAARAGALLIAAALPRGPARWIAGFGLVASGHLLAISLSGLEASLFLLCVLSSLGAQHDGRWGRAAAWAGLATLTRSEGILIALAVLASVALDLRAGHVGPAERRGSALLVSVSAASLVLGVGALTAMGGELPSTFAGRRWLVQLTGAPWEHPLESMRASRMFLASLGYQVCQTVGPRYGLGVAWSVVVLALGGVGLLEMLREGGTRRRIAIYAVMHFLAFFLVLPTVGQLGRYFVPIWALLPIFPTVGWMVLRAWEPSRRVPTALPALAVALVAGYVPQLVQWSTWNAAVVHHLAAVHVASAEWIAANVPPEEPIAAFDIGVLGWTVPNRIVDLGGITSRKSLRALRGGTVSSLLREEGVETVVLPEFLGWNRWFVANRIGIDTERLEPLHRFALTRDEARHVWPTLVACPALGVYRWPVAPPGPSKPLAESGS